MSSNGEPGGNSNGKLFDLVVIVVVVKIFTTDGINFSAKSAKDDGISFAFTKEEKLIKENTKKIFKYFFISSTK
tara:strand:+ start:575 stop:796 length:222 start_codon:yes stop_codon:yes gene_type:complete